MNIRLHYAVPTHRLSTPQERELGAARKHSFMLNIFPQIKAIASLHLGYNSNEWPEDICTGYMERTVIKMLLLGFISPTHHNY